VIEAFWIPLLPPYLIGLVLSLGIEALLTPRPTPPWRRPAAAFAVQVGVWTLAFALELALFRRPYFGGLNVLALQLLLVLVNNAKFHALREPFVYPDFEYFLDAIRHPRLYLPFFGVGRAVAAGGGYGVALVAGLLLEDSVTAGAGVWLVSFAELPQEHMFDPTAPSALFFGHTFGLAAAGLAMAILAGRRIRVAFDAGADLRRLGMVAFLWAYGRSEKQAPKLQDGTTPFSRAKRPKALPDVLPNMVVVQSESFFDARRAYPELLQQDVLANFDALKAEAVEHGRLKVVAWGANTVRTEFAFLSGMGAEALGIHKFNPYRRLAVEGVATIASYLRSLGYRTICVHPYHRTFYRRDKVLPHLGFDEFIGIEAFDGALRNGSYVSDIALGEKVIQLIGQAATTAPLYVHVITMENHGPLHWEAVADQDALAVLRAPMPEGCEDLVAYARHLRNADAMFGALRQALTGAERPAFLCIFGDHVPIMPSVYRRLGELDGKTDYLVWHSDSHRATSSKDKAVETLAATFLKSAGLQMYR